MSALSADTAAEIAGMVLSAVEREYPNKILHALSSDDDVRPPRALTPVFFGCYDWHSAVHGHWTLARLCRTFPGADFAPAARAALARSLTADGLAGERRYLEHPEHQSFEVPYGMGWLLTLHRELGEWDDADARGWHARLTPLAELGAERVLRYLRRLPFPVRTGEHAQTAFGAALYLDWADATGAREQAEAAREQLARLYAADRDGPLHLEPSGYDFLSPCLSEADLMRRVLGSRELSDWLTRFLPGIPRAPDPSWLRPATSPDPSDGKLVHLDGLCSSRAWMLAGLAGALPEADPRRGALLASAAEHRRAALAALRAEHYAGSHWLGTFATYLVTGRAPDGCRAP